jgi:oligopeptide transport system substrate-binding protein
MKKIISLALSVAMLFSFAVLLVGCGEPEDEGAYINVYLGNMAYDFDPSDYYVDSNAEQLMSLIYEPLFVIDEKGNLKNGMADTVEIDEEERTIVIELRESYWSDDKRVEAKDFVYSWCRRLLDPNKVNPAATLLFDIENAVEARCATGGITIADVGAKATGIYELTITYREGADVDRLLRNLASVATAPVREDIVGADGSVSSTVWSKSINRVTNGPFKVFFTDPGTGEFTLVRNRGYHQSPTKVDYDNVVNPGKIISFLTISGAKINVSYSDITSKVTFFMSEATLAERAANKDKAIVADTPSVYSYVFNTENPLFAIKEVRQALSVAINRDAIIAAITFGKAANGFIPDGFGGSSAALINTAGDMAQAEELLSEVNLAGVSTSFTLTIDNNEESIAIAELVADTWEELGFTVNIVTADLKITSSEYYDNGIQYAVKEAAYGNVKYDVIAVDWQTYTDDAFVALAGLKSGFGCGVDFTNNMNRTNIAAWDNTDFDAYVSAAYKTQNGTERASYLAEAEKILVEEAPIVPLVFGQTFAFVSEELKRIEFDGFGHYVFTEAKLKNYKDYYPQDNDGEEEE